MTPKDHSPQRIRKWWEFWKLNPCCISATYSHQSPSYKTSFNLNFHLYLTGILGVVVESLSHVQLFYNPMNYSPPGSSARRIRILEWVAMSFSRGSSQPRDGTYLLHWRVDSLPLSLEGRLTASFFLLLSCSVVSDSFGTSWTEAHQAYLSVGFPRQEHWKGLPFPSAEDLSDPGIKPTSPVHLMHCRQILCC